MPMKLKRKLCYKGHYMYEYVRPGKVMAALEWLKMYNPLYKEIDINSNWEDDAAQDDSELWEAVSSLDGAVYVDNSSSLHDHVNPANGTSLQDEGLVDLAREKGFSVTDVPIGMATACFQQCSVSYSRLALSGSKVA